MTTSDERLKLVVRNLRLYFKGQPPEYYENAARSVLDVLAPVPEGIILPGEMAVVTEDWTYDCPLCDDILSVKKGDEFRVDWLIPARDSETGFAFYRGTVTVEGKVKDFLCPVTKCERKSDGQEDRKEG